MSVFVLDKHQRPLMPCHPARARELLAAGQARMHRQVPFTIHLKDRPLETSVIQPIVLGIDPGSRTTGLALARETDRVDGPVRYTVWLAELRHRGPAVRHAMQQRAAYRRRRAYAEVRSWMPCGKRPRCSGAG
jgi:hypothetical protein